MTQNAQNNLNKLDKLDKLDNLNVSRDKSGRFTKGSSGNPNGRPKLDNKVKEMLKSAAPAAVKLLIDTMENPEVKPELRLKCAESIIERVFGKAAQPIIGELEGGIIIKLSKELAGYAN